MPAGGITPTEPSLGGCRIVPGFHTPQWAVAGPWPMPQGSCLYFGRCAYQRNSGQKGGDADASALGLNDEWERGRYSCCQAVAWLTSNGTSSGEFFERWVDMSADVR
jgi:hypothetical protein